LFVKCFFKKFLQVSRTYREQIENKNDRTNHVLERGCW